MLLSPAGSFECMRAAIAAGCDAVYFGVEQLNMRTRSTYNFSQDDLPEIASIAREQNIKTYLTLNTVLYDYDMRLMQSIITQAKEAGINAIIASDHAAIAYAARIGMPVHISTQCNVTNIETVSFFSTYADVIVLARELTLSQVAHIIQEIRRQNIKGPSGDLVQIEIFAHGALCMAVSGKCYLSLHTHNASANRGVCIQNCRRQYIVTDKQEGIELEVDNEYIMSAKDLCTIDFLDTIIETGASVLKIEGRSRSADYVYTTTKCYREAIVAIQDGSYSEEKILKWKQELSTVYNRGFWDGYYLGRKMGEWSDVYGSAATQRKIYIGKGVKYFSRSGIGEFVLESHSLSRGNKIMITGPTTGYIEAVADEIRVDDNVVNCVEKGQHFSIPIPQKIRPSDKLYKIVSQ